MDILIIKLSAIGDVVHTLPALEVLRRSFPEARIDWVVEVDASDIVVGHPFLNNVIVSRRKSWIRSLRRPSQWGFTLHDILNFVRELRSKDYDYVIDFQGLLKSGIVVFLSKGDKKVGYRDARECSSIFFNVKIAPLSKDIHAVKKNINLAKQVAQKGQAYSPLYSEVNGDDGRRTHQRYEGKEAFNSTEPKNPVVFFDETAKEKMLHLLSAYSVSSKNLLITISSQSAWLTKRWDPFKIAKLADELIEYYGAQIVFTGGSGDTSSIEHIVSLMKGKAINLSGKTSLKQLTYLLTLSQVLVTMDSGPMHIAAAVGTPIVGLFGPTAPWKTGPLNADSVVVRHELDCSPCFKKICESKACMQMITVGEVRDAVDMHIKKIIN